MQMETGLTRRKMLAAMGVTGLAAAVTAGGMMFGQSGHVSGQGAGPNGHGNGYGNGNGNGHGHGHGNEGHGQGHGGEGSPGTGHAQLLFHVRDYGAVGDGTADDTQAVQDACDAAEAAGGGIVAFSAGVYLITNVTCSDDLHLFGHGAVVRVQASCNGFDVSHTSRVMISGLQFDCSLQQNLATELETCINGVQSKHIVIRDCELYGGIKGIVLENAENGVIERCHGHHFQLWPFMVRGCRGFQYVGNVAHDNGRDGLKFAGVNVQSAPNLLRDIVVTGNLCYENGRDGFDLAGNNVENVQIYNNIFRDNTLQGIDCKIVYQGEYMRNVDIHHNLLQRNMLGDINCQNDIPTCKSSVRVFGNKIDTIPRSPTNYNIYAIRMKRQSIGSEVKHNDVWGAYFGIRVHDSSDVLVHHNTVRVRHTGIYINPQQEPETRGNVVEHNDIQTEQSHCILVDNAATLDTIVHGNKVRTSANVYRIQDTGTGTLTRENECGYAAAAPTMRATQGEIVRSSNPGLSGCLGWIAIATGDPAEFRAYGVLE